MNLDNVGIFRINVWKRVIDERDRNERGARRKKKSVESPHVFKSRFDIIYDVYANSRFVRKPTPVEGDDKPSRSVVDLFPDSSW